MDAKQCFRFEADIDSSDAIRFDDLLPELLSLAFGADLSDVTKFLLLKTVRVIGLNRHRVHECQITFRLIKVITARETARGRAF